MFYFFVARSYKNIWGFNIRTTRHQMFGTSHPSPQESIASHKFKLVKDFLYQLEKETGTSDVTLETVYFSHEPNIQTSGQTSQKTQRKESSDVLHTRKTERIELSEDTAKNPT